MIKLVRIYLCIFHYKNRSPKNLYIYIFLCGIISMFIYSKLHTTGTKHIKLYFFLLGSEKLVCLHSAAETDGIFFYLPFFCSPVQRLYWISQEQTTIARDFIEAFDVKAMLISQIQNCCKPYCKRDRSYTVQNPGRVG